jgi:transaldolase
MTRLHDLAAAGQAVWLDYIRRSFIANGELARLVADGVRGVTSNPTIFEKAIAGSADYDRDMESLVDQGKSVTEIYETLAFEDIREAAAVLRPVYDATEGADGYVSLEVNPLLAHDTPETLAEARRLFRTLDLPNAMIKVPATTAGLPAVTALIAEGINVNVTLIFSVAHYEAVAHAYLEGLEQRSRRGEDLGAVASVASIFVSRIDSAIDKLLDARGAPQLKGKIANDNAKLAYASFRRLFSGPRWKDLQRAGARAQRPLWASTGTKDPAYPDTLYVDHLIGPHTVNTLPPATLEAFLDHGTVAATVEANLDASRARMAELEQLGVDLGAITTTLQDQGVAAFSKSFEDLMKSIGVKRDQFRAA